MMKYKIQLTDSIDEKNQLNFDFIINTEKDNKTLVNNGGFYFSIR